MYEHPFHSTGLNRYSFLVTGGAGFIGSNICEYLLKHGAGKVRVLDNLATGYYKNIEGFLNNPSFEFIEGDIRNLQNCMDACKGIDYVFHEAALGSVPRSINDPVTSNDVNIGGFINMLLAVRDNNVKRIVYASSSSAYGDDMSEIKVEPKVGKPLSPYAVTKYVNELYASVFSNIYGINTIGLRYFNVFGPRQNTKGAYAAVVPLFIQSALNNNKAIIHGDGGQSRDFTFVENAVQANIKAAFAESKEALNTVYNAAVGRTTSVVQIFNYIKEISGSNLEPEFHPRRQGDIDNSLADISKAKNNLGYDPKILIEEGLKITFNWYKNNKEFVDKN
ncbi:MAG: SDR family oxidoreductase [Cytophagaceae bacterium]